MTEVGERPLDPRVAPRWILSRYPHHQFGNLRHHTRPPVPTTAPVILAGDQLPVPTQKGVGVTTVASPRRRLRPKSLAFTARRRRSKSCEPDAHGAQTTAEDAVLLPQVGDDRGGEPERGGVWSKVPISTCARGTSLPGLGDALAIRGSGRSASWWCWRCVCRRESRGRGAPGGGLRRGWDAL